MKQIPPPNMNEEQWIDEVFNYKPLSEEEQFHYHCISSAAKLLLKTILTHTPACADQTIAARKVREAIDSAYNAIRLRGGI